MKTPVPKRNMRGVFFVAWLLSTLLIAGSIIFLGIKSAGFDMAITELKSRETLKVIEKEPTYTTIIKEGIEGKQGKEGKAGTDSLSTHTVVEKQTVVIQQVPIQGEAGPAGKSVIFGRDASGAVKYFKYEGDRDWQEIPIVGGGDE